MAAGAHFETARSWDDARPLLSFAPREPAYTAGLVLESLRVHVRDHKHRELDRAARTLEAHYRQFVLSQSQHTMAEARRLALAVSYGSSGLPVDIAGREGRVYGLGPEPAPDDIDGRMPAVVTWHDEGLFFLIASAELPTTTLTAIAASLYE